MHSCAAPPSVGVGKMMAGGVGAAVTGIGEIRVAADLVEKAAQALTAAAVQVEERGIHELG